MTKEYTEQELLDKIPGSWGEMTLSKYHDWITTADAPIESDSVDNMFVSLENSINVSSYFLGFSPDIIKQFPITTVNKINSKLAFLGSVPEPLKKPKYNWITKIEDISTNDWIIYLKIFDQLRNEDYRNFKLLVRTCCKDELTDEQLDNITLDEVETGFFLLRRLLRKYGISIAKSLKGIIMKQKMKTRINRLNPFNKNSKK